MKPYKDAARFIVRPVHPDDAPALNEIVIHPQVARALLQLPSKELALTERMLQEHQPGLHRLIAQKNGIVAGIATLIQQQNPRRVHSGSMGLMVHPHYWGQKIGTTLITAILDLADNWLNLMRVELSVLPNNPAAIHLYENFNFNLEGRRRLAVFTDGRYHDQLVMARLRANAPQIQPVDPPQFSTRQDVLSTKVRPTQTGDAADLHDIFTHPAVGFGTNQIPSRELSATIEWLQQQNPGVHRYSAVVKHENGLSKIVGNLTLHQHQKARLLHAAWFGMSVHPDYWSLGIGSQLMEAALDLADNWLGLKRLELDVHTDNPGAIHLYEKFGFEVEGTKRLYSYGAGRWADVYFMARLAADFV